MGVLVLCRAFDAIYGSLRTAGGSGPVDSGLNRHNSGTPVQLGTQAAGMQSQQSALQQASRSAAMGNAEAQQQPSSLPSAAELLRVLDLGMRPCLEQYLPLLSPATWQQVSILALDWHPTCPLSTTNLPELLRRAPVFLCLSGIACRRSDEVSQQLFGPLHNA